jgi:transmembrane sensor
MTTSERNSAETINEVAALWAVKLDKGDLSPEDTDSLETWLAKDTRCVGALAKAQAMLLYVDRAKALKDSVALPKPSLPSRRWLLGGGLAAGLVGTFVISRTALPTVTEIRTRKGQMERMPLPDGTALTLNTLSHVRVEFSDTLRKVVILSGEVLFEVAKDPSRPFVIDLGYAVLQTLKPDNVNRFSVRRLSPNAARVWVNTGELKLSKAATHFTALTESVIFKTDTSRTAPLNVSHKTLAAESVARAQEWRNGMLAFDGISLKAACEEFERYNDIEFEVLDNALAEETITGLFSANDPKGFAEAVALSLRAKSQNNDKKVTLYR